MDRRDSFRRATAAVVALPTLAKAKINPTPFGRLKKGKLARMVCKQEMGFAVLDNRRLVEATLTAHPYEDRAWDTPLIPNIPSYERPEFFQLPPDYKGFGVIYLDPTGVHKVMGYAKLPLCV